MPSSDLQALGSLLAPAQAARAEQRRYVLREGRHVTTTGRSRALLTDADEILITIVYLRQVCPQKVLCDLLGINPVTIGRQSKPPGGSLDERKISITRPSSATSPTLRTCAWATGAEPARAATPTRHTLTDPVPPA